MSVAEIIAFEPRRVERQRGRGCVDTPVSIPIALDDLGLSPAAFRVFCALSRRARLVDGGWWMVEGLGEIGRVCFAGALPSAQAPRLRIMASDAIKELELFGLVLVDRVGRGRENRYQVMPQEAWRKPRRNAKLRRGKSKIAAADAAPIAVADPVLPPPEPAAIEVEAQAEPDIVCEFEITNTDGQPYEDPVELPPDVPLSSFDHKAYNWAEFAIGCPQVPQRFWVYTLKLMESVKLQREQTGHPDPIGDVEVYAKRVLAKTGQARYEYWSKLVGSVPAVAQNAALRWGQTVPAIDPETARSLIHGYWRELGLGWADERLVAWMAQAEQFFEGFKYDPRSSNFHTLPEPVSAKLCGDLEATVQCLFAGGKS
jgi:hypothetical protein